jgi:hypothetical protein
VSLTENAGEYVAAVGKASPPLAVTGAGLAGYSLNEGVMVATLIYTLLQIGFFIYDRWRKYRGG